MLKTGSCVSPVRTEITCDQLVPTAEFKSCPKEHQEDKHKGSDFSGLSQEKVGCVMHDSAVCSGIVWLIGGIAPPCDPMRAIQRDRQKWIASSQQLWMIPQICGSMLRRTKRSLRKSKLNRTTLLSGSNANTQNELDSSASVFAKFLIQNLNSAFFAATETERRGDTKANSVSIVEAVPFAGEDSTGVRRDFHDHRDARWCLTLTEGTNPPAKCTIFVLTKLVTGGRAAHAMVAQATPAAETRNISEI